MCARVPSKIARLFRTARLGIVQITRANSIKTILEQNLLVSCGSHDENHFFFLNIFIKANVNFVLFFLKAKENLLRKLFEIQAKWEFTKKNERDFCFESNALNRKVKWILCVPITFLVGKMMNKCLSCVCVVVLNFGYCARRGCIGNCLDFYKWAQMAIWRNL